MKWDKIRVTPESVESSGTDLNFDKEGRENGQGR